MKLFVSSVFLVVVVLSAVLLCVAQCPNGLLESGVSSDQVNAIVQRHNTLRQMLANGQVAGQPKASNMLRMRYDDNLAQAAQRIAETCRFAHVPVRDPRFTVGQNLFSSSSTAWHPGANFTQAVQAWWNEHFTYTFGTRQYNHYTQEAWANTYLVGCGYTAYRNPSGWYQKLYVCNYGPAGNYVGQTPYRVGPGCENLCNPPA